MYIKEKIIKIRQILLEVNFSPNFRIPADNKALVAVLFQKKPHKLIKVGEIIYIMQDDNLTRYFLLLLQLRNLSVKAA